MTRARFGAVAFLLLAIYYCLMPQRAETFFVVMRCISLMAGGVCMGYGLAEDERR